MKRTLFAVFTLTGLAFAGSAFAAPPDAEPRAAEREVVQPGEDCGEVLSDEASDGPKAVVLHLGPCGPGWEEVYDTQTHVWWCQPLLEEE